VRNDIWIGFFFGVAITLTVVPILLWCVKHLRFVP